MLHSSDCPVDREGVAEAYVMGTLPQEQATSFEDHYVACARCATALEKTAEYVDAIRTAAKDLRSKPSVAQSATG